MTKKLKKSIFAATLITTTMISQQSAYAAADYATLNGAYIAYQNELLYNDDITSYALYDLSGISSYTVDGVPELIVREGSYEAEYIIKIYSYDDGFEFVHDLNDSNPFSEWEWSGSHVSLYGYKGGGRLILIQHHMGVVSKWEMYLDGSYAAHIDTIISQKLLSDNDSNPYEFYTDEYYLEEHTPDDLSYLDEVFASYGYRK